MKEGAPKTTALKTPQLPQGKTSEEILAFEERPFSEAAEAFGVTPERFREILSKSAKEAENWKAKHAADTGPGEAVLEENSAKIRDAVKTALNRTYFDDVPRDSARANELIEEADAIIRAAEKRVESKEKTEGQLHQTYGRAVNLYTQAYQIQGMVRLDDLISRGIGRDRSMLMVINELHEKKASANLKEARRALSRVIHGFEHQLAEKSDNLGELHTALKSGRPLTHEENLELQKIISQAKGLVFSGKELYGGGIVGATARVLKEANIWKTVADDGTSGSAEYYSPIGPVSGYSRNSRPRRDMHGSMGGRDDK